MRGLKSEALESSLTKNFMNFEAGRIITLCVSEMLVGSRSCNSFISYYKISEKKIDTTGLAPCERLRVVENCSK